MSFEHRLSESLKRSSWHWLIGILVLTGALYAQSFSFDLVFDDQPIIKENVHYQSWKHIDKAFTSHVWSGVKDYPMSDLYRPFFGVWYTANYSLFGDNALGWHVTTVLAYLSAVVGVWQAAKQMVGQGIACVTATLLFALHPIHVETAVWVADVVDSLLMTFFCWATVFYLRSTQTPTPESDEALPSRNLTLSWLSAVFLAFALMSKEFAVFWLPMIVAYEVLARRPKVLNRLSLKTVGALLNLYFPYLVMLAVYFTARMLVLSKPFAGNPDLSPQAILLTAPWIAVNYIKLLILPINLRVEYELGYVLSPLDFRFWGSLTILAALAGTIAYLGKARRRLWVYAIWIFLPLLPIFNLWHFRMDEFMHDRYLFLPSLGFSLLVGWWVGQWKASVHSAAEPSPPDVPKPQLLFLTTVLVVTLPLNLLQIPVWKNEFTLYPHILKYHSNNVFALANLSDAFRRAGDYQSEAFLIERIIPLRPDEFKYRYALAVAYTRLGRLAEVVATLDPVERADPEFIFRSDDQARLGLGYLQTGRPRDAVRRFEALVALVPGNQEYWMFLGNAHMQLNRFGDARRAYQNALMINPSLEPTVREQIDRIDRAEREPAARPSRNAALSR